MNCGICAYDFDADEKGICVPKLAIWNMGAPLDIEGAPRTSERDAMAGTR